MRIETYLGTSKYDVEHKKHNIWIGVSLGNKAFTEELLEEFIKWSLKHTKDDVLIVVVDDIHAINIEIFDKKSKLASVRKARKMADEKVEVINKLIDKLPEPQKKKVHVARLNEVAQSKYHRYREDVLYEEFKDNKDFHDHVIDIVKEGRKDKVEKLTAEELEQLAEYVIRELPLFINGAKYKVDDNWKTYDLIIYPGLGKFDQLLISLQNGNMFPEIAKRLKVTDKIAILEAYID